jgi:hydroxymethylpyrimidine pyrophosphatase-like HAD family hydrolase
LYEIPSLKEAPKDLLRGIRLIASDIDGTMTRLAKLPPAILSAFERLDEAGVEVLPITGRPAGEALGLARYLPTVKHAIAENGATYIVPERAVEYFQKAPDRIMLMQTATLLSSLLQKPLELAPDSFCRLGDIAFLRGGRYEDELSMIQKKAQELGISLVWSSVHIHLSEVLLDKGVAALTLAQRLGYRPDEIASIGDAPNDVGLWVKDRFGLMVGTADVVKQLNVLQHHPSYLVSEGATGWLELADAILEAKR